MALRIHFTSADVGRVRVAEAPHVLWEVLLAAHMVQSRDGPLVFDAWRRPARRRLTVPMRRLLALAPATGYSPDFLTPAQPADGLEAGLEAVRRVPSARLRTELDSLAPGRRTLPWVQALSEGTATALGMLTEAMDAFYQSLLAPYWHQIEGHLASDRALRARAALNGGVDQLLASLHPEVSWRPPELVLGGFPYDRDLRLEGRGLLLLPSFFCWRRPTVLRDEQLAPVLVYPVAHDPRWVLKARAAPCASREVEALIGRTRAAILDATERGASTGELAREIRVSPATVSAHIGVLREAGLVTTERSSATVSHTLSALGRALLDNPESTQGS
ncbi:winged helix-turn-helix domain-containing protein [Streptomyces sp. NPDC057743]|uniref:winged helix-turn-helix domain-containing protein n=1 Tax=Streptomyces sp. NPDC057743 TaxID=3346236 RepID=UPI003684F52D